jgi:hypothetical protein
VSDLDRIERRLRAERIERAAPIDRHGQELTQGLANELRGASTRLASLIRDHQKREQEPEHESPEENFRHPSHRKSHRNSVDAEAVSKGHLALVPDEMGDSIQEGSVSLAPYHSEVLDEAVRRIREEQKKRGVAAYERECRRQGEQELDEFQLSLLDGGSSEEESKGQGLGIKPQGAFLNRVA